MSQNPYQTPADYGQIASMASADARASFIRKTYLHLLGAILACIAIDAIILTLFDAQLRTLVPMMVGGYNWLIVLGAFMGVSYIADRWAHSNVSQSQQYLGLGLYVLSYQSGFFILALGDCCWNGSCVWLDRGCGDFSGGCGSRVLVLGRDGCLGDGNYLVQHIERTSSLQHSSARRCITVAVCVSRVAVLVRIADFHVDG